MNPSSRIRKLYQQANLQIDPLVDQRILDTANDRLEQWTRSRPETRRVCIWRFIMFNKYGRMAAIAVILLAVLLLAPHLIGVQTETSTPDVKDIVTRSGANSENPQESPQKQKSLQEELLLADSLYANHDQAGLLDLLGTAQQKTQIVIAGYLAEIGDEQAIPALQKLADTWQGQGVNPYQQAIDRIQGRFNVETEIAEPNQPISLEIKTPSQEATTQEVLVMGQVLDRNTLLPIIEARVGFDPAKMVSTDTQGRFSLVYKQRRFRLNDYFKVVAPGYAVQSRALRMNYGGQQVVPIKMLPGVSVQGLVFDPDQTPVVGARVQCANGFISAVTDGNGVFELEGLNPEEMNNWIDVSHPDFLDETSIISTTNLENNPLHKMILRPKESGLVVTGKITANKEPVSNALVAITGTFASTRTDAMGCFQLSKLDRDNLSVTVEGEESGIILADDIRSGAFDLVVTHPEYAISVTEVEFSLDDNQVDVQIELEDACTLSGRITDDQGVPVADADIGIEYLNDKMILGMHKLVRSDVKGYFKISGLPHHSDCRIAVFGNDIQGKKHVVDWSQGECVITVSRSGRIYGRVVDAVTDQSIVCFRVTNASDYIDPKLSHIRSGMWSKDEGLTFTSTDGIFDTCGEPLPLEGFVSLRVDVQGYEPLVLERIPIQSIKENPERIEFRLQPNPRRTRINIGHVIDVNGVPVAGAEVDYRLESIGSRNIGFSRGVTDIEGCYRIAGIDPEEQLIAVQAPGYAPRFLSMSALISANPGVFNDVILEAGPSVTGRVWDEDGQPIAQARISGHVTVHSEEEAEFMLQFRSLGREAETDDSGYYQLMDLPVGELRILIETEGQGHIAPADVVLDPGDCLELNFGEEGGFVVSGVVKDGDDLLERVDVELHSIGGEGSTRYTETDATGRFKFIHIQSGEYLFAVLMSQEYQTDDPNDNSHVLYEKLNIQSDLDMIVDYQTRSID